MEEKNLTAWDRIARVIEHYNFRSVSKFAAEVGLNRGKNLYQIKRGNNGISRDLCDKITARLPGVSKAWLLTGEGDMLSPKLKFGLDSIPYYHNFPVNRPPAEPDKHFYMSSEVFKHADFATVYKSDEFPTSYKVPMLFLKKYETRYPILYGEPYFIITDYCSVLRIIRKGQTAKELLLESMNREKYDDITMRLDEIKELYLVVS